MASSCSMCCLITPAFPTASIKHGGRNITWRTCARCNNGDRESRPVVTAVEFVVAEIVEQPDEKALLRRDELEPETAHPDLIH